MRRILITGGAGFLGSHLCERLASPTTQIICLDNFLTGSPDNVAHLAGRGVALVEHDVADPYDCPVDEIFHLACPASPVHYQRDPVRTLETAFLGTRNVLELARETGARVVIASTSEIYGDPEAHPQHEGYWGHVNPIGPRACYDEGKRGGEALAVAYAGRYGVDVRIARIFNTYGPGMHPDDGRVMSNFAVQALEGEPLTIYGEGRQTRSFCYVSDLVEGLVRLMACDAVPGPINLGNPAEMTIADLAALMISMTGSRSPVVHRPIPVDDPTRRCPDINRARRVLGWAPVVGVREGVRRLIDAFRRRLARRTGVYRIDNGGGLGMAPT